MSSDIRSAARYFRTVMSNVFLANLFTKRTGLLVTPDHQGKLKLYILVYKPRTGNLWNSLIHIANDLTV